MAKTRKQQKIKRNPVKFKRLPKGPHGGIQLLLIQNIDHLGKQGDVVEVKPGYANNYLIPQGLATTVSEHHKRVIERHREQLAAAQAARNAELQILAAQLREVSLLLKANTNEEGRLYGSIGAPEIVTALKNEHNIALAEDQIRLAGPLREAGGYTIRVHLSGDIESEINVVIGSAAAEK